MKCFFTCLLLTAVYLVGCKKDNTPSVPGPVTGNWAVVATRGADGYHTFEAGSKGVLYLNADSTYSTRGIYRDTTGIFHVSTTQSNDRTVYLIRFGDSPASQYHFEKDTLVLTPFEGREYTSYAVWEVKYIRMSH